MTKKWTICLTALACTLLCGGIACQKTNSPPAEKTCEHSYGDWITTQKANCLTAGWEKSECIHCHEPQRREIPALGHTSGAWRTFCEPTCYSEGFTHQLCIRCEGIMNTEVLPKLQTHDYQLDKTVAPTCTSEGGIWKKCACELTSLEYIPTLGGHADENNDLICDTCEEEVVKVPVETNCEGNASVTAPAFVWISKESGGRITFTMGENSIFRGTCTVYPPLDTDPDVVGGHFVDGELDFVFKRHFENLTSTYSQYVGISKNFGVPERIILNIADTTETAVAVVNLYLQQGDYPFTEFSSQYSLYWGKLVDKADETAADNPENFTEITANYGDPDTIIFLCHTDQEGNYLDREVTLRLLLTQPITYFRAYYAQFP